MQHVWFYAVLCYYVLSIVCIPDVFTISITCVRDHVCSSGLFQDSRLLPPRAQGDCGASRREEAQGHADRAHESELGTCEWGDINDADEDM